MPLPPCLALTGGRARDGVPARLRPPGGNPELEQPRTVRHGWAAGHVISGATGCTGPADPSLDGFGRRGCIAGRLPNRPLMPAAWLRDSPAVEPGTALPAPGLSHAEARGLLACLYSLR